MKRIAVLTLGLSLLLISCKNTKTPQADVVAANVDTTRSPGDDFFLYANGGWINNNPIPAAYSQWSIGNLVQEEIWDQLRTINETAAASKAKPGSTEQKIGDFYAAAMDTTQIEKLGISPLQQELDKIAAVKDVPSLLALIAELYIAGVPVAFDLGVYQDMKQSDQYAVYLWQGGLGLPNRDYYFNTDTRTQNIVTDFRTNYVPNMLSFVSGKKDPAAGDGVYELEKFLAASSRELEDLRDPYANYNKMSVADLRKLTPQIDWNILLPAMRIKTDSVIVGQPEFYKALNTALTKFPIATWQNYLRYMTLSAFSSYLNTAVDDEDFRFYDALIKGKKEKLPRWKRALIWEEDAMGEELGKQYVKENFTPETKKRYEVLCEEVFSAFGERIRKLDWMSPATKEKALQKLGTVIRKIGYPDTWKDFSKLQISRTSLVSNIRNAHDWWYNYQVGKLGKPVDRTEWDMTPQTYNAYYNPSNNEIVLPAAIFKIPGYADNMVDDAVVYGYAGASTIGHEITHGFDDEGRQFDDKGNLVDWWQPEDAEKFTHKAQGYIDQFNAFVVLDSLHVNGEATLGENIADLGGLVIALDAFKKTKQYQENQKIAGYTPLQRFFMGYALGWMGHQRDEELASRILTDVHSPAFLRVNGPFSNIPEFYEAFNIKEGDKMWRPDSSRVRIW